MKNLKTVNADLQALADNMPVQRAPNKNKTQKKTRSPKKESEPLSQFPLKMRASLHRDLKKLAVNNDMTMRGFIMEALKAKGLKVTDQDMADGRRRN